MTKFYSLTSIHSIRSNNVTPNRKRLNHDSHDYRITWIRIHQILAIP